MRTIYVEVAVRIEDDADAHDTIAECDYNFTGEGILGTEIIGVTDSNKQTVF
jgi:hypothetical protein